MFTGKQSAGAAEAGRDLIENQQHVMLGAQFTDAAQVFGRIKAHTAGALYDRFKDHGRDPVLVGFELSLQGPDVFVAAGFAKAACRCVDEVLLCEHFRK